MKQTFFVGWLLLWGIPSIWANGLYSGYGRTLTTEYSSYGTTVAIEGYFHLADSVELDDNLICYLPDSFQMDSFDFISTPTVYGEGDSVPFKIYLKFNHTVLPYFYQELMFVAKANSIS